MILNKPNSSKKVRDASLQDLFSVSTFMFRFDDQLWLESWLWWTKWNSTKNLDLLDIFPVKFVLHIYTRKSAENQSLDEQKVTLHEECRSTRQILHEV